MNTQDEIRNVLNALADIRSAIDTINLEKQALIDTVITPEIKLRLAEIDAEFAEKIDAAQKRAAELETIAKLGVIECGESVKADFLHAVYSKGRVTWDSKTLDGMAKLIPQILEARKEGDPYVSIKAAK